MPYVSDDIHPRFLDRYVEIYFDKAKEGGMGVARKWYMEQVPDKYKARVLYRIRKRSKGL